MTQRYKDKVVWITGGGSGIGKAVALELGRQGAIVAVSGRRAERLGEVVDELEALDAKGLAITCDVTSETSVRDAVQEVVKSLGALDVVIANAGFSVAGRIENLTAEDWRRQLDVNVIGLAMTARHAMPHLRESKGRLALVGSVAAMVPTPGVGAYAASKYAVRAIGQTLSVELHGTGVSCTTLHPGYVESEIAQVDNYGRYDGSRKDTRPHKLMWSSERAAKVMVDSIYRRKREVVFTGHGKVGAFMGRHMPGLTHFAFTRGGTKQPRRSAEA